MIERRALGSMPVDRRRIERREGKPGVNIRHTDKSSLDSKRVMRGKIERERLK